ncbi:MAG: acetyl-CoA hydrolase/transferase C-terminal domain-containing protein [Ignavibacteria bacterium]|jgi:acyl-CoA hydrolase
MFLEEIIEVNKKYLDRFVSADEAVQVIKSGDVVYIHPGCAFPEILVDAMTRRKDELFNVEVFHILGVGNINYTKPGMEGHFRHNALFIGKNVRKDVTEGRADFTPIFLHEIPGMLRKMKKIDVALIHVSPPDKRGFCSLGTGIEMTKAATEVAKFIIAQVNPRMPRTYGNSFIHISKIDFCVEVDVPLNELPMVPNMSAEEAEVFRRIGENVAQLVENEATLQLGIGAVPDAVLAYLGNHRDLGIHSEMVSDGIIPLIEKGVVNGEKKTLLQGKVVVTFLLGTKKIFDYVDNNPEFEFHPNDFVNDPIVIAQNRKMTAINSALQIDLTGQVCSDSIGYKFYSGFGGQVDFLRGAAKAEGGKPIITLPSTAKGGTISRVVAHLDEGAGVTDTKADVHYVVTEYGIANLHYKNVRERARMLINIAHPSFREELERSAKEHHYL